MQQVTGYPHEELHAAASGTTWPDRKIVEAFAMACGGDVEELRAEWLATNAALGDDSANFRFAPLHVEDSKTGPPGEKSAVRDIEYWRHDASTSGEVQIDPHGVFTHLGAKLTIIPDTPLANRARCAQSSGWRDRIEFAELHVGSQLCAMSHLGRYASMEVRLVPSPANDGRFPAPQPPVSSASSRTP
jgi:hypothetical protein